MHSSEANPAPSRARKFRAPGRVNLVGEHTDYADGFCMPAALQFGTTVTAQPLNTAELTLRSTNLDEDRNFAVSRLPATRSGEWTDYVIGVAHELASRGVEISAAELVFAGDVPRNAGLSSSASLEVAAATAMLALAATELASKEVALLCQDAENDFVGAPCGIMDQFISVHGRAGHALQLDCRSLEYAYIPIPENLRLVIVNSMVKHSVAGNEYAERREQVEQGTRTLQQLFPQAGIRKLRDVSLEQLEQARGQMPDVVYRRCRHIISDNLRVLEGGEMLREGDAESFGKLMLAAHASYRDDFQASCAECDLLVELAMRHEGCLGSRLTGGGFGGCTVSLVRDDRADKFLAEVLSKYQQETGIVAEGWIGLASDGARELH